VTESILYARPPRWGSLARLAVLVGALALSATGAARAEADGRPSASFAAAGSATAGPATASAAMASSVRTAVAAGLETEGQRWWTRSPDPANPVACATCHDDSPAVHGWAPSFPKLRPLPPPHARVMTLLQANAEAVTLHYRIEDPLPAATAITAYLTALAGDRPVSPGVDPGQPTFPDRLRQLRASVGRGARSFGSRCGSCHRPADVAPATRRFPRSGSQPPQSLETFLAGHRPSRPPLDWSDPEMADLVAYLVSHLAGQPLGSPTKSTGKEKL
jgi:mono/diheme cytochrome c family protein